MTTIGGADGAPSTHPMYTFGDGTVAFSEVGSWSAQAKFASVLSAAERTVINTFFATQ